MTEDTARPSLSGEEIRHIAQGAGVSEKDIREIVELIGVDRASVIREARLLAKRRQRMQ